MNDYKRFQKAHEIDPGAFGLPPDWEAIEWDHLLLQARHRLPAKLQTFYEGLAVRWGAFPAIEDLLENYPPLSPFTDALYRGARQEDQDPWLQRPKHITLFRGNLCRPSVEPEAIIARIADALIHESLHWLGVTEIPND